MKLGQQLKEMMEAAWLRQSHPEPAEKVPLDDEQVAFLTDGFEERIREEASRRARDGAGTLRYELGGCESEEVAGYRQIAAELVRRFAAQELRARWHQYATEDGDPLSDQPVTAVGYNTVVELCWHQGTWL